MNIQNEIIFWTGIMRDHAQFIYNSLTVSEAEMIQKVDAFKQLFTKLQVDVSKNPVTNELITQAKSLLGKFISLKKTILERLMSCKIGIGLSPSFLNHMINEAFEFYRILETKKDVNPVLETLRFHKVWLPDASGHAQFVASQLDGIESTYIMISLDYVQTFDQFFKKAYEMYIMFERTSLNDGGISKLNEDVKRVVSDFIGFLGDVEENRKGCSLYATGTFEPLVLDHMIREEKYYLEHI